MSQTCSQNLTPHEENPPTFSLRSARFRAKQELCTDFTGITALLCRSKGRICFSLRSPPPFDFDTTLTQQKTPFQLDSIMFYQFFFSHPPLGGCSIFFPTPVLLSSGVGPVPCFTPIYVFSTKTPIGQIPPWRLWPLPRKRYPPTPVFLPLPALAVGLPPKPSSFI